MRFMSKFIDLNSFKVLGIFVMVGGVSGKALAITPNSTPNPVQHLVADLPNSLPPANLPGNSRTTVTVPPLNRPEALQAPATKKPSNLPRNQVPTVQTIPTTRQPETTPADSDVPPVIEFGQPLPQRRD
jgi:hypothetical protein